MIRLCSAVLVVAICLSLGGCLAIGNSPQVQKPTVGQELVDLKVALDKGAITQGEYDMKKAQILQKHQ